MYYNKHMNTVIDQKVRSKIVRLLEQRGIKQRELAGMIGVMPQNLNSYMTGKRGFGKKNIDRIAKALNVPVEFFYSDSDANRSRIKKARKVPLISIDKSGVWDNDIDTTQDGYADEFLAFDASDIHAFALKVVGDAMQPEFRKNDIAIVSPSVTPTTGDFVLAKNGNNVIIRRLKILDAAIMLKPLNPNYDDITVPNKDRRFLRVIGKIVAKLVRY
ncbi:repressor protein CI [Candidatus Magnetobacterium bavaricum]|uniref:Repressor protein CI n=1 Tax=Candidatus Magnetobacterium bavaricum TaxID=29290 RepID=A0A0F3GUE1_9BACT|nr:repressor protein CI [Candidatus Magnetobacterium bavaricum]